ncbi:MAG: hypothetical protein BWK78_07310 [Thiotrichaceae bacterium IS1]|nr:MAG: hypothetical protein BWK78_07310 [Thiotrichaceae bacterium IS1]
MNTKFFNFLVIVSLLFFLEGCAPGTMPSKQTGGAALGGLILGALSTQVGGGKGRTAAIVAGTLLGALIGGSVGATLDQIDQMKVSQALETTPSGYTVGWANPNTKIGYQVTPTQTFQDNNGQWCRNFQTVAVVEGQQETLQGTACRQTNGYWQLVR